MIVPEEDLALCSLTVPKTRQTAIITDLLANDRFKPVRRTGSYQSDLPGAEYATAQAKMSPYYSGNTIIREAKIGPDNMEFESS